jgi:tetratricopeptide (TPR) repeat protein
MSQKKEYLLNSIFLKNRVIELGLKQWWLAEQVGVDRKTVIRWLQGQVKSVQSENIEALCRVLNCKTSDLCLENAADQLASIDDQKQAAQLLAQSSLIEKLGPIGEWNVIESLLKATIVPGLPLNVLGDLYNQLTVASWRQSKIDQADLYNRKALDIALKTQDRTILAHAKLSQANIFSWRGKTKKAIETYKEIIELKDFIDEKALGATYSNLGGVLYESGDFQQGKECQKKALDLFLVKGNPTNHSISHTHLAIIYLKMGEPEKAQTECEKVIQFAKADNYRRGLFFGELIQAEILAHRGIKERALELMKKSLSDFSSAKIEEGLNYEIAGRICRLLKLFSESRQYLEKGIQISNKFPVYQAALYFELAKTLHAVAVGDSSRSAALKAIELYTLCESDQQAELVKSFLNSIA